MPLCFGRGALGVLAAIFILGGCGGSMEQAGIPATPAFRTSPADLSRWDLLYVSNGAGNVTVYRYWQRVFLQELTGFKAPKGECVDAVGDVFITDSRLEKIREYVHGGTKPVQVLSDRGYQPYGCSVDPRTGNLAVANNQATNRGYGGISIYPHAKGNAKFYGPIKYLPYPVAVGYDNGGNLLIASVINESSYEYASFALLPRGSQSFINVDLSYIDYGSPFEYVTSVQWDGQYWAIADNGVMVRYSITASGTPTFEGTVRLSGVGLAQNQFWITNFPNGPEIVGALFANTVDYWNYPSGGSTIGSINDYLNNPFGVVVSRKSGRGTVR